MAFITNIESPYRCAIMEDWNWALGYDIGKDVETARMSLYIMNSWKNRLKRGPSTGFPGRMALGGNQDQSVRIGSGWSEETAYTIQRSLSTLT